MDVLTNQAVLIGDTIAHVFVLNALLPKRQLSNTLSVSDNSELIKTPSTQIPSPTTKINIADDVALSGDIKHELVSLSDTELKNLITILFYVNPRVYIKRTIKRIPIILLL